MYTGLESFQGLIVTSFLYQLITYRLFFFGIIKVLFVSGKFDRIFIYAPSPITVGLVGIFASIKFNSKSFVWVQDLWPESVSEAGKYQ